MVQRILNNKGIIVFLIILGIYSILAIIFRLDLILGIQSIITLFAVLVALGASILSLLYNNKILRQSEINLNTQLLHEDKKKALQELLNQLKSYNNIFDISDFIKSSPNSIYLPDNTQNLIEIVLRECKEELESDDNRFNTYEYQRIMGIYRQKLKDNIIDNLLNPN